MAPPERGRPKNIERRVTIARAAARLFAQEGYTGTSMREIAAAAGIRESLLYHYFPAKRDILGELVIFNTKLLREVDRRVTIATRRTYACRPFLRAVGREYLHYVFQAHELLVLWLWASKSSEADRTSS